MIPALLIGRGGSRGVPGKNLMPILGRPLMSYPVLAARHAKHVDRVFLSTEDSAIKAMGVELGLEIIDRPPALATDEALVEDVVVHGYEAMRERVGEPEMFVLLFCNSATLSPEIIDRGITTLRSDPTLDSAVSVSLYNEYSPVRAMRIGADGVLGSYVEVDAIPGASCDRDAAEPCWFCDCSVWVLRPRCVQLDRGRQPFRWIGRRVAPLRQSGGLDIDHGYGVAQTVWWLREQGFTETATPYEGKALEEGR